MHNIRRATVNAGRNVRSVGRQQPRRYAHDAHDSTHQTPPGPSEESLGRGFYFSIAAIPVSLALYKLSAQGTDEQPFFTRIINSYDSWRKDWVERNDLHVQAIEQAARDRNLFLNSATTRHVHVKFPEMLNTGSPYNVPAGHGSANIDQAIAKFQKENNEANEEKLQALRDNNVKAEKPYEPPRGRLAQ